MLPPIDHVIRLVMSNCCSLIVVRYTWTARLLVRGLVQVAVPEDLLRNVSRQALGYGNDSRQNGPFVP